MGQVLRIASVMSLALWTIALMAGCASEPPPPQSPSNKEIRSNSDRFFDKMKQEEKDRQSTPGSGY
jgi:hypothetical protein